jgi:translation initiation factor 2B subunit (eIF-2B alpha/beta/delta family)
MGGIIDELANTITFFNKMSAKPENQGVFKSRLQFKAISEIFSKMIKRELSEYIEKLRKEGKVLDHQDMKKKIAKQTRRLQDLCDESKTLIQHHSRNVLRDRMTVLVHGHSECVLNVLKGAQGRGVRIHVISTVCSINNEGQTVKQFCDAN